MPGCEDDTLESDDDNQANMSLNFRPANLTGARTHILPRISHVGVLDADAEEREALARLSSLDHLCCLLPMVCWPPICN